jgi:succinate dehydrogenase / fumarate reductase membrane anchor subunit
MPKFRTPIAKARGLGSAHSGARHWMHQRITAVINLVLLLWFAGSVVSLAGAGYADIIWWVRDPIVTVLLVLLIANLFYHIRLGVQVVIEDYVHKEGTKALSLILLTMVTLVLALLGIVSVLKVSFGG